VKTADQARLENLKTLLQEAGSAAALAERVGTSPVYISQLRGGSRSIGNALARRLELAFDKPIGWLDTSRSLRGTALPQASGMPLYEQGSWQRNDAGDMTVSSTVMLSPDAFAVLVTDREMVPVFEPGDIIIVDPGRQPRPGDYALVKVGDDAPRFGRYRDRSHAAAGERAFEVVPENEDFAPIPSAAVGLKILGVAVEQRRLYR